MRYNSIRGFLPFYCMADGDGGGGGDGGDTGFVGSDGTFKDGWTGRDEFKDNADTLGRFKNVTELANSYTSVRNKMGKNPDTMVEIPSETSSDDVRAAWGKANGVPVTVDEYTYEYSDDFATKLGPLDDAKMAAVKEFAHKELGLSNAKYQKLLDFYHTNILSDADKGMAQMDELTNQRVDAGNAILKGLWLESMEDRTKAADTHLEKYANFEVKGKDGENVNVLQMLFDESPNLKDSPWLILAMDNMASKMGEANRHGGGGDGPLSLEGINFQINAINDRQTAIRKENPVNFKSDQEFKRNDEKLNVLYQKKFPPK